MVGKRGNGKPTSDVLVEENGHSVGRPSMDFVLTSSESDIARLRLRERWELASVLNFLHIFQPIFGSKLEFTAEEIETALITPNDTLARLHVLLLKGIPPVSKSLTDSDVWIKALFKKLYEWWPWVAEGEIPLTSHGEEIPKYKEIDPSVRLQILKALCEIRLIQDDALSYINDALKDGTELSTFRKDRIAGDGNRTSYWYDGDSVIGHRLYREVEKVEYKQSSWEKGQIIPPTGFLWETLATNLEEFREISDKLSSSEIVVELNVGRMIENEILPVLEKLQKKKERALKRQQQEKAMLQSDHYSSFGMKKTRTCRDRRTVCYTFDEYDKSIDEAIEVIKGETTGDKRHEEENDCGPEGIVIDEVSDDDDYDGKDEVDDDDIDDSGKDEVDNDDIGDNGKDEVDDDDIDDNSGTSEKESKNRGRGNGKQNSQKRKGFSTEVGLRRSRRIAGVSSPGLMLGSDADMKKQLKQRPPCDSSVEPLIISDSEDGNSSEAMGN